MFLASLLFPLISGINFAFIVLGGGGEASVDFFSRHLWPFCALGVLTFRHLSSANMCVKNSNTAIMPINSCDTPSFPQTQYQQLPTKIF